MVSLFHQGEIHALNTRAVWKVRGMRQCTAVMQKSWWLLCQVVVVGIT